MSKPGTTHVIEIETGIGEPAFIPLTMGSELQPISVGKKGMWRIESARVLDVHAFVYFDGSSLFVQSADESNAASVDGYRVGKAWTELHAPCKIEIGAARLRFRSLSDAPSEARAPTVPESQPRPAGGLPAIPGEGSPTRPGVVESRPVNVVSGDTRAEGQRSARQTGQLLASGAAPVQAIPASQHPPGLMNNQIMSGGVHNLPPTMPPNNGVNMNFGGTHVMPGAGGMPHMPPMMAPMQPMQSGSMSYGGAMGPQMSSGTYGAMGGNRGAPTVQTTERQGGAGGGGELLAKYNELSPPKRLLVLMSPFCLIAAAYLLLFDDDEPAPEPAAMVDAGPPTPVATGPTPPINCPPGFVPYTIPVNGQIPCVPLGTPMPPPSNAPQVPIAPVGPSPIPGPGPGPGPSSQTVAPAAPPTSGPKTLERQAVDAVAVNDYNRAAAIYETLLAQSNPKNPVYAEAARILRQKADAGAP